eukprot:COSAG06_NODE_530_length_14570_cov_23.269435_1_plen_106_part_00
MSWADFLTYYATLEACKLRPEWNERCGSTRKIKFKFQAGLVRSSEWVLLCVCVHLSAHRRLALPRELGQQGVLGSYTVTGAHLTAPFRLTSDGNTARVDLNSKFV